MQRIPLDMDSIFVEAHNLAGRHIQEMIGENRSDFTWIRPEITNPSFDDLNFRYKNQVFSVLIKIFHQGRELSEPRREIPFIRETKANNLVPCVFPVNFEFAATTSPHGYGVVIETGKNPTHELVMQDPKGWNLFHVETNKKINPLEMADDTPVLMSAYEMQNFAIQIVRNQLEKEGLRIESFCDAPTVLPHIWFRDKEGKLGWIVVKYGPNEKSIAAPDGNQIARGPIAEDNGYFAPVGIQPMKGNKAYRGIGYYVNYSGLINIYKGTKE